MSADLVEGRATSVSTGELLGLFPLARREAWRMVTSPAMAVLAAYFVLVVGVDSFTDFSSITRSVVVEFLAVITGMMLGVAIFLATHLTASSARRAGAEAQLSASPMDPVRRDLALCLGVLLGPAMVCLALSLLGAALSRGLTPTFGEDVIEPWTITDVLQGPAMVLGAGILGIVVARWLPFPGSLLIGWFGMVYLTLAMTGQGGATIPWLSWFMVSSGSSETSLIPQAAIAWHTVYLFAWSALGVCVVGLRQSSRKRGWMVASLVALAVVALAGYLQLPPYAVTLNP